MCSKANASMSAPLPACSSADCAVRCAMQASGAVHPPPLVAVLAGTKHTSPEAEHVLSGQCWTVRGAWGRACARNCSEAVSSREGSRTAGAALVATGFGAAGSGANATCAPA